MKKYFFRYFAYIFFISILIIAIQSGSIFFQYRTGLDAWKRSIFDACIDDLESNLGRSMFPKIKIDGLDLFGSIAHDNRISGYLVRNSEGAITLTVGQTPDGRVLASVLSPDEKITDRKKVKSKRLEMTLNASLNEDNGAFSIQRSRITTKRSESFVPRDVAATDILGSITVAYMDDVLLTFDILTYTPRTYIYSKQIIEPIFKSLLISFPVCFLIAFSGAWFVSSRNANYINSVRIALKKLAEGNETVSLDENKNIELNEITVAIKDLGKHLAANNRSRITWLNSISHDLNTPAAAMKMIVDGMIDGVFKLNKHNLKDLQIQNDILSERIRKVIDYSTLISDTKPNLKESETKSVVPFYDNCDYEIKTDTVFCDPDLMSKAVIELINNAREYGSDVKLKAEKIDTEYKITVSNKGQLPDFLSGSSLFEPWTKGDSSRTSGGNGLGLPIVSAIAALHNGKAEILQQEDYVISTITWTITAG